VDSVKKEKSKNLEALHFVNANISTTAKKIYKTLRDITYN